MDKIQILNNHSKFPSTFEISDNIVSKQSSIETFYSKFCKYTLGISKYASNILTLGELGRYPIIIKSVVSGILYWWRLEQGTVNPLLNRAYNTMKEENHQWLQNIQFFLFNIGMGDIWLNPSAWEKESLKSVVTCHLQNIFIQKYDEYICKPENVKKCKVMNVCDKSTYSESKYLNDIESPQIRSIFTKLRLDINATWDSKMRSFRYKNVQNDQCPHCNNIQNIEHVLLLCNHPDMEKNRKTFMDKYGQYSVTFKEKENACQVKEILNLNLSCPPDTKNKATETICMYIKKLYWILEQKVNSKK